MIARPPVPVGDLTGMTLALGSSMGLFQGVVMQIQQTVGPDTLTTVQMSAAVGALVTALVFIHRLLMKAKEETLGRSEAGFLGTLAAHQQTINILRDQASKQEVVEAVLRQDLAKANDEMVSMLKALNAAQPRQGA